MAIKTVKKEKKVPAAHVVHEHKAASKETSDSATVHHAPSKKERYIEAVGRRKTAIATGTDLPGGRENDSERKGHEGIFRFHAGTAGGAFAFRRFEDRNI